VLRIDIWCIIDPDERVAEDEQMAIPGLTSIRSSHGPEETMSRFDAEVRKRGMTVFARIDHAAGADSAGLTLRPTELLIFGTAKSGTPLMVAAQTTAIDLPLKAIVWQDEVVIPGSPITSRAGWRSAMTSGQVRQHKSPR
jgi:uncharacterized protein (DUF302 family)